LVAVDRFETTVGDSASASTDCLRRQRNYERDHGRLPDLLRSTLGGAEGLDSLGLIS
jgi:hypothetical protein